MQMDQEFKWSLSCPLTEHWQPKPNWRREKLTYILVCDRSYLWVSLCAISVLRTPLPSRGCWYVCNVMFLPLISLALLQLLLHVFYFLFFEDFLPISENETCLWLALILLQFSTSNQYFVMWASELMDIEYKIYRCRNYFECFNYYTFFILNIRTYLKHSDHDDFIVSIADLSCTFWCLNGSSIL